MERAAAEAARQLQEQREMEAKAREAAAAARERLTNPAQWALRNRAEAARLRRVAAQTGSSFEERRDMLENFLHQRIDRLM